MGVRSNEHFEGRLIVSCEQLDPGCGDGLVVDMRGSEVCRVSLYPFSDQSERFVERFAMKQDPR